MSARKWLVPSWTNPKLFYTVTLDDDVYRCTCPAFLYHSFRHCKHIDEVAQEPDSFVELQEVDDGIEWF